MNIENTPNKTGKANNYQQYLDDRLSAYQKYLENELSVYKQGIKSSLN